MSRSAGSFVLSLGKVPIFERNDANPGMSHCLQVRPPQAIPSDGRCQVGCWRARNAGIFMALVPDMWFRFSGRSDILMPSHGVQGRKNIPEQCC